jgi:(p)ppGpp synthase/HD superfamily hydrolase
MIYTEQTKNAMRIAYEAHKDALDKSDLPYIYHPVHLAERMDTETACAAALLHDVVEDTDMTFEELKGRGVSDRVIDVVRILTHDDKKEEYMDYIRRVKGSGNADAIKIKLADLAHNSDITRLNRVEEKLLKRIARYKAAYELLLSEG